MLTETRLKQIKADERQERDFLVSTLHLRNLSAIRELLTEREELLTFFKVYTHLNRDEKGCIHCLRNCNHDK